MAVWAQAQMPKDSKSTMPKYISFEQILSKKRAAARAAACLLAALFAATIAPATAMVGGAEPAANGAGRSVVMVLGSYGTACSATAIARAMLLTAGHRGAPRGGEHP